MSGACWLRPAGARLLLWLGGCATQVSAPPVATPTAAVAEAAWAQVLEQFVDVQGEVDFAALSRQRGALDVYLRYIADTPLESFDNRTAPQAKLAHMINAYNALSMFNVIDSGIPSTNAGLAKVEFFVLRRFEVGGEKMSLYAFENDVIRPYTRSIGEPRVHFALNCSAVSSPKLPRTPFTSAALDRELERETRSFFNTPQNFRLDAGTKSLWLSEILSFYIEDFVPAHAASLRDYANRYAVTPAPPHYRVRYTDYDWTVANSRRLR